MIVPRLLVSRTLIVLMTGIMAIFFWLLLAHGVQAESTQPGSGQRLLVVHDGDSERGFLTYANTLRDAFMQAGIAIDPNDRVEPGIDEPLVASNYEVNIYRAQPVTIIDGNIRIRVMSPYRTAKQIVEQAGLVLHDEDIARMTVNNDIVSQGVGIELTVARATEFRLSLYGKAAVAYTQANTIEEMLKEKGVILGGNDTISVPLDTKMVPGIAVAIWRNGVQTVTDEQAIPFETQKVLDVDHSIGYHDVKTKGVPGMRLVTYEVTMQDGKEVSRKQVQNIISSQPKTQIELIGNRPVNPLSKTKGAGHFTDSQGVSHRETYYDLPMNVVIGACGGGTYTIRADGAKVDQGGYILIAANYNRYPRCSIVETSMGLGKVYDTGGFVVHHPDGFDLATDWTNHDGR
jgi:uncharacterized protein YabE (DUF348 family)